jgi:hypothetical protein
MAEQKSTVALEVKAETGDATKKVGDLKKDITGLGQSAEKSTKSAKGTATAFGSIGNALKSLGIISVISAAFNFFREVLSKNQKVADSVGAVFATISTVISTLIDIVISVTSEVGKSSNGFQALGKVISGIITLAITPLKLAFDAIKLVIKEVQLAFENSPFGDKDQNTIKELTKDIEDTKKSLSETGENAIQAGKDIFNNFGEAATSVVNVVSGVVNKASKINVAAIYEQSKATIALQNSAKIAEAQLQGLVEKYDRQAEQLRQVRDDEFKSIDERIAANDKLKDVLNEQEKAQKALAMQRVAAAQAELAQNKTSTDLQAAVITAQNEVAAVEAQIAGLRSEQLVNATALTKEKLALDQSIAASENKLLIERKKANAELIKEEIDKLNVTKRIAAEEAEIELKRLQDNINNTKAGTQARVDANIAYAEKKQQIELSIQALDNQIAVANFKRETELLDREQAQINLSFQERINSLNQEQVLVQAAFDAKLISETEYNQKVKSLTDERIAVQNAELDAKLKFADASANALTTLSDIAGRETAAGKGLAVAASLINTYSAIAGTLRAFSGKAIPGYAIVQAVATGLAGLAAVRNIIKTKVPGKSSGAGAAGVSVPTTITPPVAPQAESTRLDQGQINQIGSASARAFVVESDITGNQEKIRRLNRQARIN